MSPEKKKPTIRVRIVDNQLQEVKKEKTNWVTILRWIMFLPIACLAFYFGGKMAYLVMLALDRVISIVANPYYFRMIVMPLFVGAASGYWFMLAGVLVAPKYREKINSILLVVVTIFAILMLVGLVFHFIDFHSGTYFVVSTVSETIFMVIGSAMGYSKNKEFIQE